MLNLPTLPETDIAGPQFYPEFFLKYQGSAYFASYTFFDAAGLFLCPFKRKQIFRTFVYFSIDILRTYVYNTRIPNEQVF